MLLKSTLPRGAQAFRVPHTTFVKEHLRPAQAIQALLLSSYAHGCLVFRWFQLPAALLLLENSCHGSTAFLVVCLVLRMLLCVMDSGIVLCGRF